MPCFFYVLTQIGKIVYIIIVNLMVSRSIMRLQLLQDARRRHKAVAAKDMKREEPDPVLERCSVFVLYHLEQSDARVIALLRHDRL